MEQSQSSNAALHLPASLSREWVEENQHRLLQKQKEKLILDFSDVDRIDSAAAVFISLLNRQYPKGSVVIRSVKPEILAALRNYSQIGAIAPSSDAQKENIFVRLGDWVYAGTQSIIQALVVLADIFYWGTFGLLKRRDFRKGVFGEQMYQLGFRAAVIVCMLSFLIGMVLALQTAIQLKTYGGGIFLAGLIGFSMIRELGPLLTAIILAGRSGSATTAEIATMVVGEEIDALKTMGINPIQFVVVPKFWAITLTMPVLTLMASAIGIFGGFLISTFYLEISPDLFWSQLKVSFAFRDFLAGFIKSVVFSWIIVWIGAVFGFRVSGGAEEVGRETTACVVAAIFVIIMADAAFSFFL